MKIKKIIIFIIFLLIILINTNSYSSETNIISSQEKTLGISEFIKEADKYIDNDLIDINVKEIFNNAKTGNIGNINLVNSLLNILGKEVKESVSTIGIIIIIIIFHSILNSISENIGKKGVSKITYFVEYILIVSLILKNFSRYNFRSKSNN